MSKLVKTYGENGSNWTMVCLLELECDRDWIRLRLQPNRLDEKELGIS